jgi:hypothetical protein
MAYGFQEIAYQPNPRITFLAILLTLKFSLQIDKSASDYV